MAFTYVIIDFLTKRTNYLIRRQAFASLQHGFLRSEENVVLYNFGKCEYIKVSFGLGQAPAYFQELMTAILKDFDFTIAYLDNIIILAGQQKNTCHTSERYLRNFNWSKLSMKLSKCHVDICFSSWFYDVIIDFLTKRTKYWLEDKLLPVYNMDFLRSGENVPYNFETPEGVWKRLCHIIFWYFYTYFYKTINWDKCYASMLYRQMFFVWQMLFAIWDVVDVITTEEDVISSYCL